MGVSDHRELDIFNSSQYNTEKYQSFLLRDPCDESLLVTCEFLHKRACNVRSIYICHDVITNEIVFTQLIERHNENFVGVGI